MLVYHFKGRLVLLEDKCNTMFEIMNSMVKEMKNIKDMASNIQSAPVQHIPESAPFGNMFPPELIQLFGSRQPMFPSRQVDEYDDDESDGEEEQQEYKKIVVSDTEMDEDDDDYDESDVKVISVDISEPTESEPLADLEEENLNEIEAETEETEEKETPDYKKMDVSYLRTMVMTRGLATDTKKLKKPELIRLLEQSFE